MQASACPLASGRAHVSACSRLAWGIDSFGRGQTTRPALQHEGLFTGHAQDSGKQPHRPSTHRASMIVVAEAHSGSSCGSAGATCPRRDAERWSGRRQGGAFMGGGGMSLLVDGIGPQRGHLERLGSPPSESARDSSSRVRRSSAFGHDSSAAGAAAASLMVVLRW
jgi:hypothetical protein